MKDFPHIEVRKTKKQGKGVFATKKMRKGTRIASFDGEIYDNAFDEWDDYLYNHVIQFERRKWRNSRGVANLINHSCQPNCGIKNLFDVVTMRTIQKGEELFWDYAMTENYVWSMKCTCGTPTCRKRISTFKALPLATRKKYEGFISEWLLA
jgi:SET domain-containing protein